MKLYKKELLFYVIIILLLSLIKAPFIAIDEELSCLETIYQYYIHYGDLPQLNIIWLAPILVSMFFITKSVYLKLMNFNLRYHNRKDYFIRITKLLLINVIIYCLLGIVLQLPALVLKTNLVIEMDKGLLVFILKYLIELLAVSAILLLVAVLIKNYTYAFVMIVITIISFLTKLRISWIPFITLYTGTKINIISLVFIGLNIITLYYRYIKRDIVKGITK